MADPNLLGDLLDPDDEALVGFQQRTTEYYLGVAGSFIRKYLGWHLSPSVEETVTVPAGEKGLIMLPSRYVTAVSDVTMREVPLDADQYTWTAGGWIQTGRYFYDVWPGLPLTPGQPISVGQTATVTFTHGYDDVPAEVKQVAYELVYTNQESPAGNVSHMSTPAGYRVELTQDAGFNLNPGQARVLAPYRLAG